MRPKTVTLDVREDIRAGKDPFARIMQTVAGLKGDDRLRVIAPFKPEPLLGVLQNQGFSHQAKPIGQADWEVLFTRETAGTPPVKAAGPGRRPGTPIVEVDARGLEPPQPMIRILEALEGLPAGTELRARTDRRPVHLYPHLEERGYAGVTKEQNDGSCITHIRRR